MAVAIDATGTDAISGTSVTSFDFTGLTIGAGLTNSALVVFLTASGTTATGTTPTAFSLHWDSAGTNQVVTQIGTTHTSGGTGTQTASIWGLVAPTAGNKTLHITWTNSGQVMVDAISVSGADQTGGVTTFPNSTGTNGSGTGGSVTVTSAVGNMVAATWEQGGAPSFTSTSATQVYVDNGGNVMDAGATRAAGAATVTMTATWSTNTGAVWAVAATDILAAAAGGDVVMAQAWM